MSDDELCQRSHDTQCVSLCKVYNGITSATLSESALKLFFLSVRQVKQTCTLPRFVRDIAIPTPIATETIIKAQCADVSLEILCKFYKKHFT